jgi:hypothetical protein
MEVKIKYAATMLPQIHVTYPLTPPSPSSAPHSFSLLPEIIANILDRVVLTKWATVSVYVMLSTQLSLGILGALLLGLKI